MRYTLEMDDWARRSRYLNRLTGGERWRILLRGDRLRGIGRNPERPAPVHRDRVRFGAWEARPSGRASDNAVWCAMPEEVRERFRDFGRRVARDTGWGPEPPQGAVEWNARAVFRLGRLATDRPARPTPVPAEGPADSGGSQTYKRGLGVIPVSREFADDVELIRRAIDDAIRGGDR